MRFKKKKIRTPWFYKRNWNLNNEDALWVCLNFYQTKIDRFTINKKLNKFGKVSYWIKKYFSPD
jgi:hypothetical protein